MLLGVIDIPDDVIDKHILKFLVGFEEGLRAEYVVKPGNKPPGWRRPLRNRKISSLIYEEAIREISEAMAIPIPGEEVPSADSEIEEDVQEVHEEVGEVEAPSSESDVEDNDEAVNEADVEEFDVGEEEEALSSDSDHEYPSSSSSDDDHESDSDFEP